MRGADARGAGAGKQSLMTGGMALLVLASLASFFGFQLLLSVVPLYAEETGGGSSGAGLATAALMLSTVLTQTRMPGILGRFGYGGVLSAGLLFLGLPALFYGLGRSPEWVLAVTLVRGVGFGIVTVVFAALVAELAPSGRRGEALGLLGISITVPTIFCNALGLWIAGRYGYWPVFLLGGAAPLLGLLFAPGIRVAAVREEPEASGAGFLDGLGRGPLLRLFILFSVVTLASGVVVTFLPLARPGGGIFSAAGALLVFGVASTLGRWWAGRFCDRRDPRLLLPPGLVIAAAGMSVLPWSGPVLLAGALLFGLGFGVLQNTTLVLTMSRVYRTEYGLGSTLWNVAFDAGTGVGALLFGFVVDATGFPFAFRLCGLLLLGALFIAYLDRRAQRREAPGE